MTAEDLQQQIDEIDRKLDNLQKDLLRMMNEISIEGLDLEFIAGEVNYLKYKKRELQQELSDL